jgi:hypothetical protein
MLCPVLCTVSKLSARMSTRKHEKREEHAMIREYKAESLPGSQYLHGLQADGRTSISVNRFRGTCSYTLYTEFESGADAYVRGGVYFCRRRQLFHESSLRNIHIESQKVSTW